MDANSQQYGNELVACRATPNAGSEETSCVEHMEALGVSSASMSNRREEITTYWTRLLERVKTRSETTRNDVESREKTIGN